VQGIVLISVTSRIRRLACHWWNRHGFRKFQNDTAGLAGSRFPDAQVPLNGNTARPALADEPGENAVIGKHAFAGPVFGQLRRASLSGFSVSR
jgi:hypothetical protein